MKPGDLVRITIMRSKGDEAPALGIITKSLGTIEPKSSRWFKVLVNGEIVVAVNESEIEVINEC